MRSHEITKKQPLLNEKGDLLQPGWARSQLFEYHRADIKAPKFRIKEWDYYMVLHDGGDEGDSYGVAFTLSDDGYVGLQSVSLLLLNKDNPWEHTETVLNVFPMGKLHLPETSDEGDCHYEDKRLKLHYKKTDSTREISCVFHDFYEGKTLTADLVLEQPKMESMVIATPWDKAKHFYYNQKINTMKAQGKVEFDGKSYEFSPQQDYGTLDWGRGVWTYDNTWYWGSGNANVSGHDFGFNIGFGFGNTSKATENVIFYDKKIHKLDDVSIEIPNDIDLYDMDSPRYMDEWKISESNHRFEMTFVPILDRFAKMDFKLIVSDQHQVFGRMTGFAILDDGSRIELKNRLCFIEKVHNKY